MAGLSGGQSVRRYTGGAHPHRISYAIWFTWHAKLILTQEQISAIETAMEESFLSQDYDETTEAGR